ncbi:MAG: hypothetical protein EOP05_01185 [Proteobacteria bacterium]|nr:MAG: hypothetical protein EOP05_01185 [Pseudomonadota bacterium]
MSKLMTAAAAIKENIEPKVYDHELQNLGEAAKVAGSEAGADNRPKTSDTNVDANENELHHAAGMIGSSCKSYYEKRLRVQETQLDQLEAATADHSFKSKLQNLIPKVETELQQLFTRDSAQLTALKKSELELQAAVNFFKVHHQRREPAHYPISSTAHYTFLAIVAAAEAVSSVYFYFEFTGIIGALIIAIMASAANVVVSAFWGTVWRNKNHVESSKRYIGWSAFVGWLAYAFYLNKFLATFRSHLSDLATQNFSWAQMLIRAREPAFESTFMQLPMSGFSILDLSSWFLFIFGMIVSVASFLKGYNGDDTYPGYGETDRKLLAAREAYQGEENRIRNVAIQIVSSAEAEIAQLERERTSNVKQFIEMSSLFGKTEQDYRRDLKSLDEDLKFVVKLYRDANSSVRVTPAPNYFSTAPELTVSQISISERWQSESLEKLKTSLEQSVQLLTELCSVQRRLLSSLNRENGAQIDQFFKSIENAAKTEIGGVVSSVQRAS